MKAESGFEEVLGRESSAQTLWDLLRRNPPETKTWRVGPAIASKIMARKRPHLIPIDDSVVTKLIGLGRMNSWRFWWEELGEDGYLTDRAEEIKEHVGRSDLSTLRALDIVLWQFGRKQQAKG